MPTRMHALRPANALSQDIELTDVGTDPKWQMVPLSGSASTVIDANSEETIIGRNGQETGRQSSSEGDICTRIGIADEYKQDVQDHVKAFTGQEWLVLKESFVLIC